VDDRVAWIVARIEREIPMDDFFAFLGLLGDDSGGVRWAGDHGLIKTNFSLRAKDPAEAEQRAIEKFEGMMDEAGLPSDAFAVQCVVSPPAPGVGWHWSADLS
jgi:hypothetical protein